VWGIDWLYASGSWDYTNLHSSLSFTTLQLHPSMGGLRVSSIVEYLFPISPRE